MEQRTSDMGKVLTVQMQIAERAKKHGRKEENEQRGERIQMGLVLGKDSQIGRGLKPLEHPRIYHSFQIAKP